MRYGVVETVVPLDVISMKQRSQGATEYLLILAITLVAVGAAIFFVMRSSPSQGIAPSINVDLNGNTGVATTVKMTVNSISSTVAAAGWKYVVYENTQPDWQTSTEALAAGQDYTLTIGEPVTGGAGTYTVKIFHIPTNSIMFQGNVQKS